MFKKIILYVLLLLVIGSCSVYAEETMDFFTDEMQEQYKELLENSGANDLFTLIPDEAQELINENQINSISPDSLMGINFFSFVKSIFISAKKTISRPLTILLSCIGVILLCSMLNSLKSSFNNSSYERVFSVVSVMCISTTIIIPIAQMITKTAEVIKQVSTFILSFVPVYVGIITASGKPISAVSYNISLISIVQVISRISASVLVPLLAIYLAFCLIGATSTEINIEGIARSVKTIVILVLSFLMTIFVGLLTVQGIVATSSDTVAIKATKFALSAFLPVVGTAISEALNSVQGCMGVIKSTVGGFGIVVIVATFLPSIVSVLLMQFSLSISASISEMMDTPRITSLLRSAASVLSLLLGILLVYFVLLVVSVTIMLTLSTAGA